jgi:alpha-glucosidase
MHVVAAADEPSRRPADPPGPPWWRAGVLYQIYPRSYGDSNGDGVGDLPGIIDHLDHLRWLGVDGIWLCPINVSPNADWGYDVADYLSIDPELGSDDDVDRLIAEAGRRGIRILVDLVPSHTSEQHPWFVDSRSSRTARHRNWYVWADPKPDGSAPNNWVSSFGGPPWDLDEQTDQYYRHTHLREQPDLNWWEPEVRAAFDVVMTHWLDRGIAGFRIDAVTAIVQDVELRDNPSGSEADGSDASAFGQHEEFNSDRPEVHDVLRHWRRLADRYQDRVLLGETSVPTVEALAPYYGNGDDELHLAFDFPFISAPLEADALRGVVEASERVLPAGAWPVWTGSNHDVGRFATRWAAGSPAGARVALLVLLCLRGTPVLYQGDELGQPETVVSHAQLRDPLGARFWPHWRGRDGCRTPMQWRDVPGGGFTPPGVEPWLPLGDVGACNVADQMADRDSMLHLARDLIALRRAEPALHSGSYRSMATAPGAWAWSRDERFVVLANLCDEPASLDGITGTVRVGTDRSRDGEAVDATLVVSAWEAVVVDRNSVR